jgi:hypothetical protein
MASASALCATARGGIVVNSWSLQNYALSDVGVPGAASDYVTTVQNAFAATRAVDSFGVTASTDFAMAWNDSGGSFRAAYTLFFPTGNAPGGRASLSRIIMTFTTDEDYPYNIDGTLTTTQAPGIVFGASLGPSYFSGTGPFQDLQMGTASGTVQVGAGPNASGSPSGVLPAGSYVYGFTAEIDSSAPNTYAGGTGVSTFTLGTVPEASTAAAILALSMLCSTRHRSPSAGRRTKRA